MELTVDGIIKQFMPKAGHEVSSRIKSKLGVYQTNPKWSKLAPVTIKNKRRHQGMTRLGRSRMLSAGNDNPLIDTGAMYRSVGYRIERRNAKGRRGYEAIVFANHPMAQHEQDREVGSFQIPEGDNLPRRPAMWPSVEEKIDKIVDDLENHFWRQL